MHATAIVVTLESVREAGLDQMSKLVKQDYMGLA